MRQGGEPHGVQVVRQGEPTPYHCDFNPLYLKIFIFGSFLRHALLFGGHTGNISILSARFAVLLL